MKSAGIGVVGRSQERELLQVKAWNPRDYATGNYRRVDERPFGGGPGMLMLNEPLSACLEAIRGDSDVPAKLIYLSPQGQPLTQAKAKQLASCSRLILLCGRYEGVDHRVREHLVDGEISVGDVVLSGGEVAACLVIEAVTRLREGAMGNAVSTITESFGESGLLEEPQFTRPAEFRGWDVPDVLRSGDHARIDRWRRAQRLHRTLRDRPDLIEKIGGLSTYH